MVKCAVYIDVLSHWCYASVPAMAAVADYLGDAGLEIVFAPLNDGRPLAHSSAALEWYLNRGFLAYGNQLSAGWYEEKTTTTWHANAATKPRSRSVPLR